MPLSRLTSRRQCRPRDGPCQHRRRAAGAGRTSRASRAATAKHSARSSTAARARPRGPSALKTVRPASDIASFFSLSLSLSLLLSDCALVLGQGPPRPVTASRRASASVWVGPPARRLDVHRCVSHYCCRSAIGRSEGRASLVVAISTRPSSAPQRPQQTSQAAITAHRQAWQARMRQRHHAAQAARERREASLRCVRQSQHRCAGATCLTCVLRRRDRARELETRSDDAVVRARKNHFTRIFAPVGSTLRSVHPGGELAHV